MAETTRKRAPRRKPATKKRVGGTRGVEERERARSAAASSPEDAVARHRLRQASVAAILDQVFGPFGASDPKLWERRAYLLLVGSVYERLAMDADLDGDELVKLARVLAESRRSKPSNFGSASQDGAAAASAPRAGGNGRFPDRFGDMVRDLYGADVGEERSSSDAARRNKHGGVGG